MTSLLTDADIKTIFWNESHVLPSVNQYCIADLLTAIQPEYLAVHFEPIFGPKKPSAASFS
uniref:Uncharacterized protein n=1 Tax=Romanomermis culicivorax TaxID=13658 RepID=A0A915HIU7_ROMCU